jgi:uncharacterized membrane protein YdbT with pleckstrin-like domain
MPKQTVSSDKIIHEFGVSKWYIALYIVVGILLAPFIVGILFVILGVYYWMNYRYILTDKRIIAKRGIFNIKIDSAPYSKITDISLFQRFGERIFFRMGTLEVNTAGSNSPEILLNKIENPKMIKQIIFDLMEGTYQGKRCVYCSYSLHSDHMFCPKCGKKT